MKDENLIEVVFKNLYPLLKCNGDATRFCCDLMKIAQVWDDLIDRDDYEDDDINHVFHILLFTLPLNPFYIQHQDELRPLIMNTILKWNDANKMESEKEDGDLHMAYMLRAEIYSIFCYVALLVGGSSYAKEVGVQIRRLYGETMKDYLKEMNHA